MTMILQSNLLYMFPLCLSEYPSIRKTERRYK